MKKIYLFATTLFSYCTQAQNLITLETGAQFFISANSTVAFDKLVLQPSADVLITGTNSVDKSATLVHPSTNRSIKQVFQFINTIPAYSGDIILFYDDADLNGIPEGGLTLNIHNGVRWSPYVAASRDLAANFVSTTGLANVSLNELTLASIDAPLPVRMGAITATCGNGTVRLNWKTLQEENNKRFDVERSSNGINWQVAGSVLGGGNNANGQAYSFNDNAAAGYYRLVQIDMNGAKHYSPVLKTACGTKALFEVYPNPFKDRITILVSSKEAADAVFQIRNTKGQLLRSMNQRLAKGNNYISLTLGSLPAGSYWLNRVGAEGAAILLVK